MTTETLSLYEIRTIGFEALLRELGPQARSALFNSTSLAVEITRKSARSCCRRNLSVKLAGRS